MKCRTFLSCLGVAFFFAITSLNSVRAQGTAFIYQGNLQLNSSPANGAFDMQFKLHPSAGVTNQVGPTITSAPVGVTNGLFSVTLDFGNVFDGSSLFLEVGVRPNGSGSNYTILSPAQPILSVPYAIRAAVATAFNGTIADSQLSTNVVKFTTGGGFSGPVVLSNATGNFDGTLSGTFNGAASGTFSGAATGTFNGTNTGTFIGNGAGVTNLNVTNLVGVVQSNPNWQLIQSASQQAVSGNNYLTTNNAMQTLILPPSPGIGSIIRISGSGANGWMLQQNSNQSVITANLGLPAGQAWTGQSNSQAWHAVASSATGLKLAAAYGTGFVYFSNDGGLTWTKSDAPSLNWTGIAMSADGTRMVAVPNGGNIYTSTNGGTNWTAQTAGSVNTSYSCVASSADGINLVAAVGSGLGSIYTSTNGGINWTARIGSQNWTGVASSANGTKLVAVPSGAAHIFVSGNSGATWTNFGPLTSWSSVASSADGNKLVATANTGNIYTSGDGGVTWTPRASSLAWKCVTSSADGVNLAAAYNVGFLYTSTDSGQTWLQRTNYAPGGAQAWSCIASSASGARLLAAISTGQLYTSIAATTVGSGKLSGTQFSSVELQYIGNGQWMPLTWTGSFTGN